VAITMINIWLRRSRIVPIPTLRDHSRGFLDYLLRRSQCDQHYADDCEHSHSREFSAFDHVPVFLRCHYRSMRKVRQSAEGDQAAVRRWVTYRQQQKTPSVT